MFTYRKISIAGLAVVAAAAPLLAAPVRAAASVGPPVNIVAIGDSYASGEGDKGSGWIDSTCERSAGAAPQRAAGLLNATNRPVNFTSVACFGSTINNSNTTQSLLGPGGQLNAALDVADPAGTHPIDALTISIGGNDIGFANIVADCMTPFNSCPTDPNVTGIPGLGTVPQALQALGGYSTNPGALGQLIQAVNAKPDIDNVFLTEYPDPTTGPGGGLCGTAADPAFSVPEDFITSSDAAWASGSVVTPLDNALKAAASYANTLPGNHAVWRYVSGISSAFNTHGYCNQSDRYVNTLGDSIAEQGNQDGTMHPNDAGQQAIADVLYNDYVTGNVMSASVSPASAVAGSPSTFTVQALSFAGTPVANAAVLADGNLVGHTASNGVLTVSGYEFPTAGNHTIVTQEAGWASAQAIVTVQPRSYGATSSPSPIPVGSSIPALTLTATDNATSQTVPGTFTLTSGSGTLTVRSGATANNVTVTMRHKTETIIGPTGKPITVTVPVCPALTFKPDSAAYTGQDFSSLIKCTL